MGGLGSNIVVYRINSTFTISNNTHANITYYDNCSFTLNNGNLTIETDESGTYSYSDVENTIITIGDIASMDIAS